MSCCCCLGFVCLVEQKQVGVVLALQDVKALIARFLDGLPVIQDRGLTKGLDLIGFHADVNAGDVHDNSANVIDSIQPSSIEAKSCVGIRRPAFDRQYVVIGENQDRDQ